MEEETVWMDFDDFKPKKQKPAQYKFYNSYRVDEYTIDGEFIRSWDNASQAADHYNINTHSITSCATGKQLTVAKISKIFLKRGDDIGKRLEAIDLKDVYLASKPYSVVIRQYNLKGKLIQVYPSISIAADLNNMHCGTLSRIVNGKVLFSSDGYIFLRDGESIKTRLELIKQYDYNSSLSKSIDNYHRSGKLIKRWKSVKEAAEHFGINALAILDCCLGKTKFCKGQIFVFSGEDINERVVRI